MLDQEQYRLGVVGVSGDTSERDELCAINGIQAAGLRSQPEEVASNWQASTL